MRPPWVVLTVAGLALLAGWCALIVLDDDAATPSGSGATGDRTRIEPGRVVHVERGSRTTFLPLGVRPQDGRTLSAQRAYNLLVADSPKLIPIPATVQPYYGVLDPAPTSRSDAARRVWAFTSESGCHDSRAGRCRLWEFVDARTGHDLGVLTQVVLPG